MGTLQFGNPAQRLGSLGSLFFNNFLFHRKSQENSHTQQHKVSYKLKNSNLSVRNLNVHIQKNHILKNVCFSVRSFLSIIFFSFPSIFLF